MDGESRVTVTDIDMHFWSMVWFLIKLSIATIPAGIVLFVAWSFAMAFLAALK
jgi:hypothetical protein